MGTCRRPDQVFIRPLGGKPNKKKIRKVYNEAYNQVSSLWNMFPPSAQTILKSDVDESTLSQDGATAVSKIKDLKEKVNSLKGKQVTYKEKMEKKKFKNQLKKKSKLEEKRAKREEKKRKQKELREIKSADKKSDSKLNLSDNSPSLSPSPVANGNDSSEEDDEVGETEETIQTNLPLNNSPKKKPKKEKLNRANIEDITQQDEKKMNDDGVGNQDNLSKKKLKLLDKKRKQLEAKKEKRKLAKQKKKQAVLAEVQKLMVKSEPPCPTNQTDKDSSVLYNKIDFEAENQKKKFKKEKPKTEKDPVKALEKIEKLDRKITELKERGDVEKAAALENKESWKKAILKADGVKVKDNVKLIKKTIKRKENKKSKSKTEWDQRKQSTEKRIADAQKRRKENIQKKKKEKKQKKIKKSIKKGRVVI